MTRCRPEPQCSVANIPKRDIVVMKFIGGGLLCFRSSYLLLWYLSSIIFAMNHNRTCGEGFARVKPLYVPHKLITDCSNMSKSGLLLCVVVCFSKVSVSSACCLDLPLYSFYLGKASGDPLGKRCPLGFPLVLFCSMSSKLFVFLSHLVSVTGCRIWLYRF